MAEEEIMETEEEEEDEASKKVDVEGRENGSSVIETESQELEEMLKHVINCEDVFFRSQQRGEDDLRVEEKRDIGRKVWHQSKSGFLSRFGKHLREEHLEYFQQFVADEEEGYAVAYFLGELRRFFSKAKREKDVRNRRYDALRRLTQETDYFCETEMMRRNPLLYHQLVGQYLSAEEKKKRDNIDTKNITFVNLLLETIDRDSLRKKQQQQRDIEECAMQQDEEDDDDDDDDQKKEDKESRKKEDSDSWDEEPTDKVTKWGEFPGSSSSYVSASEQTRRYDHFFGEDTPSQEVVMITATERRILKEEFLSIMYQDFLDGKDPDFDYSTVDDNEDYDNLELKTHDAEDSYFDSETPEDVPPDKDALPLDDEDELEVFMSRLNKHPTVQQLSDKMLHL